MVIVIVYFLFTITPLIYSARVTGNRRRSERQAGIKNTQDAAK